MAAYARVAEAIQHVSLCCLGVTVLHYVDDFFGVVPVQHAQSTWTAFTELHELLNVELEDDKGVPPVRPLDGETGARVATREMPLLGVGVSTAAALELVISPLPDRVERVVATCNDILTEGSAFPSLIGSLAGRLGFTASATHGRTARAYIRPLY